jgi:hypothetical protein
MLLGRRLSRVLIFAGALIFTVASSVSMITPASADCMWVYGPDEGASLPGHWSCPPGETMAPVQDKYAAIAVSKNARAVGVSYGPGSLKETERWALARCSRHASDCTIQMWGVNLCIALAISLPEPQWGYDSDPSRARAKEKALVQCRGAGGKSCKIATAPCPDDE